MQGILRLLCLPRFPSLSHSFTSDLRSVFSSKSRWKRENKKWKGQEKDLREDKSRNASETKQPVNQSRFMSSSKVFYWFRCFIIFTLFISFLEKLFFLPSPLFCSSCCIINSQWTTEGEVFWSSFFSYFSFSQKYADIISKVQSRLQSFRFIQTEDNYYLLLGRENTFPVFGFVNLWLQSIN